MANVKGKLTGAFSRYNEVKLALYDPNGALLKETDANKDGGYTIAVAGAMIPGDYTIKITNAPDIYKAPGDKTFTLAAEVTAGNTVGESVDIQLEAQIPSNSITGKATNDKDEEDGGIWIKATSDEDGSVRLVETSSDEEYKGQYIISDLIPAGKTEATYKVEVVKDSTGAEADENYIAALSVPVMEGQITKGIDFFFNKVKHFLSMLDDARFSIEARISKEEANQAVSLFAVSNIMLAGLSQSTVGGEEKIDMLGVLDLYYGLQDKSLASILAVQDAGDLWADVGDKLKALATNLDSLQSDVAFLKREAKRQFNLGTNTDVVGNTQFPTLLNRYVEIATDPLLSIDISGEKAKDTSFMDQDKLEQGIDLLADLKAVILQIVSSLSKYGTAATKRVNEDWAVFEAKALEVLVTVGKERVSDDLDEKNPWAVLAVLTGRNRETDVAPYVVLGRHGVKLLQHAMEVYKAEEDEGRIDDFDRDHLLKLFQDENLEPKEYRTALIRKEAAFIKRYPLANWG